MTPAQRRNLRRMVDEAGGRKGFDALVGWVEAYRVAPDPAPLQPDGTNAFAATAHPCDPARCSVWTRMMRRFA